MDLPLHMKYVPSTVSRIPFASVALALLFMFPVSIQAGLVVTTDTTQDGGTLFVNPAGVLGIADNSLLTLTGGANTSGVQQIFIGAERLYFGLLRVEEGSSLTNSGDARISSGTATVTGSDSQWTNEGNLAIGGYETGGTLNITNGGLVTNLSGFLIRDSTVTVSDPDSQWRTDLISIGETTNPGSDPTSSLNIKNGGLVSSGISVLGGFGAGTATITGLGSKWEASRQFWAGGNNGTGTLTIENGGALNVGGEDMYGSYIVDATIGNGGNAEVTVTGTGSVFHVHGYYEGTLTLGLAGTGKLTVADGGLVTSDVGIVGSNSASHGIATISGIGSQWQVERVLYVDAGGTLTIENGGLVTDGFGYVGSVNGTGIATITGAGSLWQNIGNLYVGYSGTGTLIVENGGEVSNFFAYIGDSGGTGTANITGAGSQWVSYYLTVGDSGTGTLIVQDGGIVEVTGSIYIGTQGTLTGNGGTILGNVVNAGLIDPGSSPGILTIDGNLTNTGFVKFELAGTSDFDQLIVTGLANLSGVLEVDLLGSFNPIAGDSFKLLDFDRFNNSGYTFDFAHAALRDGLWWDTSTFEMDGTIRVVPEVESISLATIAIFASLVFWLKKNHCR